MSSIPLCNKSLHWIFKYYINKCKHHKKLQIYGFVDDHTVESWKWTIAQSNIIEKYGIIFWINNTEGPYGFYYWKRKYNTK
jgi:hypothetical protein